MTRHDLEWLVTPELSDNSWRSYALSTYGSAIERAVRSYRTREPKLPPSRVARDRIGPAVAAAARLKSALQDPVLRAHLDVENGISVADLDAMPLIITRLDIPGVVTRTEVKRPLLGAYAECRDEDIPSELLEAERLVDLAEAAKRADLIRFRLACEILRTFIPAFSLGPAFMEGKAPKNALVDIIILAVNVGGIFKYTRKVEEGYLARGVTEEALSYIYAEMFFEEQDILYADGYDVNRLPNFGRLFTPASARRRVPSRHFAAPRWR